MHWRLSLLLALAVVVPALGQTTRAWVFHNGEWAEATRLPSTQPMPEPQLDEAERLLQQNDPHDARKILLAWEKANKTNPARDRCIYLLAQDFFESDNRIKSFYYCDELMDEYPQSPLFESSLQKQYDIADAYLNGYKDEFLFLRIWGEEDEAVQMMYRIQQRAPGSPLAEKALLRTADYYYSSRNYDLAEDAYNVYVRSYPRSPNVPLARLHAAFASMAQFRGELFDPTNFIDARAQLIGIIRDYPDLATEERLQSYIDLIDDAFARKILYTAEFYDRTHQSKGAVYDYRFLVQTYPKSAEAVTARQRLTNYSASQLAEAPPTPGQTFFPATMPSAMAVP